MVKITVASVSPAKVNDNECRHENAGFGWLRGWRFYTWNLFSMREKLLQLEADIHRVAIASAEAARQRIDTGHALERREHGCVQDRVSAATNNVGAGY